MRMRWVGRVAGMGKNKNVFRILVGDLTKGDHKMDLKDTA